MDEQIGSEKTDRDDVTAGRKDSPQGIPGGPGVGRGWRRLALLLMIIVVALVGVVVWYGLEFHSRFVGVEQRIVDVAEGDAQRAAHFSSINQQLTEQQSVQITNDKTLSSSILEIENKLNSQASYIAKLTAVDRDDWLFSELEYMARVANERLLTERHPAGALSILLVIDERLSSVDGAGILTAREALARNITALRTVEVIDRVGLYTRLGALIPVISSLSALPDASFVGLASDDEPGSIIGRREGDPGNLPNVDSWYMALWTNIKTALSRLNQDYFHVRYRQVTVGPLLASDQEQWLRQNMVTNVGSAQLALLRQEQVIYHACLAAIESLLLEHFVGSSSMAGLLQEVQTLQERNIVQQLPDISQSMLALDQLQSARSIIPVTGSR